MIGVALLVPSFLLVAEGDDAGRWATVGIVVVIALTGTGVGTAYCIARNGARAKEIAALNRRLREAHRIARLGSLERRGRTGGWLADDEARRVLGLVPGDGGETFEGLFAQVHPEDLPQVRRAVSSATPAAFDIEFRVRSGAGERVVHALGSGPNGCGTGVIVTLQDVSERRLAERERTGLIERMAEAGRLAALGTLAGGIAHEINNPAQSVGDNLVFIKGASARLLDLADLVDAAVNGGGTWAPVADRLASLRLDFLKKELPAAADQAIDGTVRIGNIVQAIREFCYPSNKTPMPLDLNHAVEIALSVAKSQWKYVAAIERHLDDALPMIMAIEGEIVQVLINIIVNAAQAIAERKSPELGRIAVRTRRLEDAVEVCISDTGMGIHTDSIARIFDMFYTTKAPGRGTGQGLAIVHAIVSRHGGRITVESQPGEGTAIHVVLPIECERFDQAAEEW